MLSFAKMFLTAALAGAALAQSSAEASASGTPSTAGIPACALSCTTSTIGQTECQTVSNLTCICNSQSFQRQVYQCYVNSCSPTELIAAEKQGASLCAAIGVTLNISATPSGITLPASFTSALATASAASAVIAGSSTIQPTSAPASGSAAAGGASQPATTTSARSSASQLVGGGLLALFAGLAAVYAA